MTRNRIEEADRYGRELARLNLPSVMIGAVLPAELDEAVEHHFRQIHANLTRRSDMTVEGMGEAIDIIVKTVRAGFMAETKALVDNWNMKGGNA